MIPVAFIEVLPVDWQIYYVKDVKRSGDAHRLKSRSLLPLSESHARYEVAKSARLNRLSGFLVSAGV